MLPLYSDTGATLVSTLVDAGHQLSDLLELDWKIIERKFGDLTLFHRYHRSISAGMQEYIEAYCFWYFLKNGQLCGKRYIQQQFHQTHLISIEITLEDYVGGVSDMSGELMRRAISILSSPRLEEALGIYRFLRVLEEELYELFHYFTSLKQKWITLQENIRKVENACYLWKLREFDILSRTKRI